MSSKSLSFTRKKISQQLTQKMAAVSGKLFHLMLIILTLQNLTTVLATQSTILVANKNETEVRCQKWVKNGESGTTETGKW